MVITPLAESCFYHKERLQCHTFTGKYHNGYAGGWIYVTIYMEQLSTINRTLFIKSKWSLKFIDSHALRAHVHFYCITISVSCFFAGIILLWNHILSSLYTVTSLNTDINSSTPEQNGRHFADDIFKCIFVNEKFRNSVKSLLNCILEGPIDNNPALDKTMAWHQKGDKPLFETMLNRFTDAYMRHIYAIC